VSDAVREIQAVLGRKKPAQGVRARDFRQPRRMSQARLGELRVALENGLPALERRLHDLYGPGFALALQGFGEFDAEALFAGASAAPCVLRFKGGTAPAWLVWDPAAAALVLETLFGAKGAKPASRVLSISEARVATQLLAEIVRPVCAACGVAAADFAFVQTTAELGTWREAGPQGESYRLEVRLELRLGEQKSVLALYLSGVDCGAPSEVLALPETLPAHLEHVEVELSARLRGCELSLDQLLGLETGDVVPLEARLGDPTTLCVEGLTLGEARLGSHRGRLAVRIEHLNVQPQQAA
jgi:flagellar motor switch protein FliM